MTYDGDVLVLNSVYRLETFDIRFEKATTKDFHILFYKENRTVYNRLGRF